MRKSMLFGVLAVVLLFGAVGLATADTVTYPLVPGSPPATSASGTVSVTANVNPKISLTITTPDAAQTVAFGDVEPGVPVSDSVDLEVSSNKIYDLDTTLGGDDALIGLTTSVGDLTGEAKGTNTYTDTYDVDVPFSTDPGAYTATVQYTVTQQ